MQIPQPRHMTEIQSLLYYHPIVSSVITFVLGSGGTRALIYISKKMPPLPSNSGWWAQFFYSIMKGASGLDPNATLLPANTIKQLINSGALPQDSSK